MNYDSIILACESNPPSLIYLAVGSANSAQQQYPPFVAAWPGKKVCILIDPMLETPPLCFQQPTEDTTFFILRQNIEYPRPLQWGPPAPSTNDDVVFIHNLCVLAIRYPETKMIFQDYSGRNIEPLYPIEQFGTTLQENVLFDVTYGDGGCFIDFSKINILRDTNGNFFQPKYTSLQTLRKRMPNAYLISEMKARQNVLAPYVHHLYGVHRGTKTPRDWWDPMTLESHMRKLCVIYGDVSISDPASLKNLLRKALFDYCATAEQYMSDTDADDIIELPNQYNVTLNLLRLSIDE